MSEARRLACDGAAFVLIAFLGGCERGVPTDRILAVDEASACDRATREAAVAIAAGSLTLKEYPPLPSPPGHEDYVQLLRERCNVNYEAISKLPENVDEAVFRRELEWWNDAIIAEIERTHGDNILSDLREEAGRRWRTQINAQRKPSRRTV